MKGGPGWEGETNGENRFRGEDEEQGRNQGKDEGDTQSTRFEVIRFSFHLQHDGVFDSLTMMRRENMRMKTLSSPAPPRQTLL